jgi:hypothetical protein
MQIIRAIHGNAKVPDASQMDDSEAFILSCLQVTVRRGVAIKTDHRNVAEHVRAYRRRIAAAGEQEVLVRLSNETVAAIDEVKQRLGLQNRGQVVEQLFRNGGKPPSSK